MQFQLGQTVTRTFAWASTDNPDAQNFTTGTITAIDGNYLYLDGDSRPHPMDMCKLSNVKDFPVWVPLTESLCAATLRDGFDGSITKRNMLGTEFEVTTENAHQVSLKFDNFLRGTCDCNQVKFRKQICQHLAFVGLKSFERLEVRAAA